MTIPRATLRLQFHSEFTFADATQLVDYFAELGVSHVYASPITRSQPGSTHGYDTVDYSIVNPELGGEPALRSFVAALHAKGLGLIVDIVPNHMGVGGADNGWWLDLLEHGPVSQYADYFDVDWQPADPALHGKVLAPFLGEPYGDALNSGNITLGFDAQTGKFHAAYYAHRFPIRPADYPLILANADGIAADSDAAALRQHAATAHGQRAIDTALAAFAGAAPDSRAALHALLERQHYRLAWWRSAADEINWRRFFDISALGGMRVESEAVFDASHALILRLYQEGLIDGVRVDHVDGLAAPREYCQRLRERLNAAHAKRSPLAAGSARAAMAGVHSEPWLVIEKILARDEPLRTDWQVDGTTGYDFMNDVGALLHDPAGAAPLADSWAAMTGRSAVFADEAMPARYKVLAENLNAELDRCARALHQVARANPATRDYSLPAIRRVLTEIVAHYSVYRIYPVDGRRSNQDERYFAQAREGARAALRRADHALLDLIDDWLGAADVPATRPGSVAPLYTDDTALRLRASTLFSQLTSPVAAKAIEDTACYRYGRLISRNEVGADPGDFAMTVEAFHAANLGRAAAFPHAMLNTATHDHKRGEDVRARLAVLSEIPDEWAATLRAWSTMNAPLRRDDTPGPDVEIMLYQTLVGCWPPDLAADNEDGIHALAERVAGWLEKALREAKLRTDWFAPDTEYEKNCRDFLFDILAPRRREGFLAALTAFVERIAPAGVINSLQQTLLRMTSPGVPDLYQGTELWDFSLVDPDNRRPVDYGLRRRWLTADSPAALLPDWRNGRVKMALTARVLALRNQLPALFLDGGYLPLTVVGPQAHAVIAFARRLQHQWVVVIATRLAAGLMNQRDTTLPLIARAAWQETAVLLPETLHEAVLINRLDDDQSYAVRDAQLLLQEVLGALPVALLLTEASS